MEHKRNITAEEYYSDPNLKRMLNAAFNKYRSYGSGRGKIKLLISRPSGCRHILDRGSEAFWGKAIS